MFKRTVTIAMLLAAPAVLAGAARAASIITQVPCVANAGEYCKRFSKPGVHDVRNIPFTAPGPGTAVVTFHGALTCINFTSVKGEVHLRSQIVGEPTTKPLVTGESGLIHTATLPPEGIFAFNLASTRVFTIEAAGLSTFYFRVRLVDLSPGAGECRVYNAAFTIAFEPAP
jgi:hypothetical protein